MCTNEVYKIWSNPTDPEQGLPDGESRRPLLGSRLHNAGDRLSPPRPTNLNITETPRHPERIQPQLRLNLSFQAHTPSTTTSTANNTPITDTGVEWPKKWRRSDRRLRRLNTELLEAIETLNFEETERLLNAGANPNATCRLSLVSACHMAALTGGDALSLLLKFGAEKLRLDSMGRTPLHLAAWAANARQMAMLLDFPEDIQLKIGDESLGSELEDDLKQINDKTRVIANVPCDLDLAKTDLPSTWKDNIDHNCRVIEGTIPVIQMGWTPLHVASACARLHCTRLLLAAGADPNFKDCIDRTPLDVVGAAYYFDAEIEVKNFIEVISMLLNAGGTFNTMRNKDGYKIDTPLHVAVELECLEAINLILDAGASITCQNANGQTPLHLCVAKQLETPLAVLANYAHLNADPFAAMVDVKDSEGHTVLQTAIEATWVPGVCIALEAGADVTLQANDGMTPIHSAASLGNIDVLNEILSVAKQKGSIDIKTKEGETPLFSAIINGHLDCVKAILNEGASIKITLPGNVSVFHKAAEHGHLEVLQVLFEHDAEATKLMINSLTTRDKRGFGPIHFAVMNNHAKCVEFLLNSSADIRLRSTDSPHKSITPLHLAAIKNHLDVAKIILDVDNTTIHEVNSMGWFPLHSAGHHGSRDVITLLLKEGADLSGYTDGVPKYRRTAIDMIINNITKPTEFLEEVFDSYITMNSTSIQDPNCEIEVDYRILMPSVCEMQQMKVVEALLKTGNRHGQKKLLVHPLMESYLHLKWRALLPFFYTIMALYTLFSLSLTVFIVSVFFYRDTKETTPSWLNAHVWAYFIYITILLIVLQEILYMNVKSNRHLIQLETWVKFGSIALASILPPAIIVVSLSESEWPRHVATVALLLSWLEMMFLLSRLPNWGYYVLMFGKVASNVVKILLTFAFLVIGFSLSFMIQFRSQVPFEGPWSAIVKTMVMMTSEFDYGSMFDQEHITELSTSILVVRIIFVIFLILAAIVLMNLLVGVAVSDINDLEILGNVRRLAKQAEFLGTLDILVYNRVFKVLLPKKVNNSIKNKRKVSATICLRPGMPRWKNYKALPSRIRDAIFDKAQTQKTQQENDIGFQIFKNKIDEIHRAITKKDETKSEMIDLPKNEDRPTKFRMRHDEIVSRLNNLEGEITGIREQINLLVQAPSPVEELNTKIDKMSFEMEAIKQTLFRFESKLGE